MIFITGNVFAYDTSSQVEDFIAKLCQETIVIASDKNLKDADKTAELSNIFIKAVDVKWIGKFAMGRYYKGLNPDQQNQYDAAFSKFLINSYVPNFKKYTSETVKVVSVTNRSENEYLAQTEIIRPSKEPLKVNYMIRDDGNGNLMIFDVIAEGISLISTKRAEFESVISSSDPSNLIKMLEDKVSQ
jgi:phospholipid transport system substrate-binding protein